MASFTDAEQVLAKLLDRLPGVQAVTISTDDGTQVARAVAQSTAQPVVHGADAEATLVSLFTFASEQISKIREFGGVQSITAFYRESCLVHVTCSPLVLTFIGGADMNVGLVLSASKLLVPELKQRLPTSTAGNNT